MDASKCDFCGEFYVKDTRKVRFKKRRLTVTPDIYEQKGGLCHNVDACPKCELEILKKAAGR